MKILVVLPRFPYPLEKGDKLRAYHQIRVLSQHHEIYLFCISHTKVAEADRAMLEPFCKKICIVHPCRLVSYKNVLRNYLTAKSIQIGYWDSQKARKAYKRFEREVVPDVIYSQMVRTMTMVARSLVPKVMDFQDALSKNVERRMDHARWPMSSLLHFEFKMLRSSEYNSFRIFDDLTIISEPDSEAIPHLKNGEIHIIPNGVDFDYFAPQHHEKDYDIVFCGNMQYEPNVNAARYLVEQVMPLVWKQLPNARVMLAGASPKPAVRKLASDQVTVTGWVEDIRLCYARSRVFAAPMQMGSGLQNKLLEAMAMGIPCVTTSLANASLCAQPDTEVLVGDDAETFASHLVTLLQQPEKLSALSDGGRHFVQQHFSWESSVHQLEEVLASVAGKPSAVSKEKKR